MARSVLRVPPPTPLERGELRLAPLVGGEVEVDPLQVVGEVLFPGEVSGLVVGVAITFVTPPEYRKLQFQLNHQRMLLHH